jgi:hypothetical protein
VPNPRRRQRCARRRKRCRHDRCHGRDRASHRQQRPPRHAARSVSSLLGALAASLDANHSIADELKKQGYSEGTVGSVQTFFMGGKKGPWTAEKLENFAPVDTLLHLSRQMILRENYPGIDVMTTRSRLLDNELVGQEEVVIARSVRNAIGSLQRPVLCKAPFINESQRTIDRICCWS